MKARDDTTPATSKAIPRLYSYIRFSSAMQADGSSEERQEELLREFAKELNARRTREGRPSLPLDESHRDLKVTSWHGAHVSEGVLGQFVRKVESGEIATGSWLVVEDVSRLGRAGFDFMYSRVLTPLWKHDITVQFLKPRLEAAPGTSKSMETFLPIYVELGMAQRFSEDLSRRVSDAKTRDRRAAREEKRLLVTKRFLPAWLRLTKEGERIQAHHKDRGRPLLYAKHLEWDPRAAVAIEKLLDLKIQEGLGKNAIAARLNALHRDEGGWAPPPVEGKKLKTSPGWRQSYVGQLLRDRRLIGECVPHVRKRGEKGEQQRAPDGGDVVENFFPVLDSLKKKFLVVQKLLAKESNHGKKTTTLGGRSEKATNLLARLAKCAYCGSSMLPKRQKGRKPYLFCEGSKRGLCSVTAMAEYEEVETLVLENCKGLHAEDVLATPQEQVTKAKDLSRRLAEIEGSIEDKMQRRRILDDQIEITPDRERRITLEARIGALKAESEELTKERATVAEELSQAERGRESFAEWQDSIRTLTGALKKARESGDTSIPLKLRTRVRDLLSRVDCFTVGYLAREEHPGRKIPVRKRGEEEPREVETPAWSRGPEDLANRILEIDPKAEPEFLEFCTKQAMSKAGRFVRVHFKNTTRTRDLAPTGSLAFGWRLEADGGWSGVSANLDRLRAAWKESVAT